MTKSDDLRSGLSQLRVSDAEVAMAVTTFDVPIQRALRELPDESAEIKVHEYAQTRSHDLEEVHHDTGQFYWACGRRWLADRVAANGGWRLYLTRRWRVQETDTWEDWELVELPPYVLQRGRYRG